MRATTFAALACGLVLAALPAQAQDDGLPLPTKPGAAAITTGFDPKIDGLSAVNVGSYDTNGGDCFGFSAEALTRFEARKAGQAAPANEDEVSERALAGVIQNRYETEWKNGLSDKVTTRKLSDPKTGNAILKQLSAGTPVILDLQGDGVGHAVVAYGYDGANLVYYDPNFPGESKTWPFDPKTGFGPLALTLNDKPVPVVSVGFYPEKAIASAPSLSDLSSLRASCDSLDATCSAIYMNVQANVSAQIVDARGIAWVASGSVSGGLATDPEGRVSEAPTQVAVYVNGGIATTAPVDASGHFSVNVFDGSFSQATNDVRIVALSANGRITGFADAPGVTRPVVNGTPAFALASGQPVAATGLVQAVAGSAGSAPGR